MAQTKIMVPILQMGSLPNMNKLHNGNRVAKDLRSPKYAMRVVPTHKQYNRAKSRIDWKRDAA
jgi:hypothetical protein